MKKDDIVITTCRLANRRRKARGFSLVEVVIALGVVSFSMVSVIGLLPVGLSTFKQAMTNTVESQIVQGLTNDILLTDFANLSGVTENPYTYDNEGRSLTAAGADKTIYTAVVSLKPITNPADFPVNFQSTASGVARNEAYQVQILITNKTQPLKPHTYSVILANSQNNKPPSPTLAGP